MASLPAFASRSLRARASLPAAGGMILNLTPLLDVLFFLVFFLIVSANFERLNVIPVELPEAGSGKPPPPDPHRHSLTITLFEDGSLTLNDDRVEFGELRNLLGSRAPEERLLPVVIQGDRAARFGDSARVLDMLRLEGYQNCSFEVRPSRAK